MKDWIKNAALPVISQAGSLLGGIFQRRYDRKMYREMQDYNSPRAQMQRYREAGLSPYLIYGAANAGNVSTPAPSELPADQVGKGIQEYIGMANFSEDIKAKRLNNAVLANQERITRAKSDTEYYRSIMSEFDSMRKALDLASDYEGSTTGKGSLYENLASTGFRRKANELKLSLSAATLDKIENSIEGMKSDNVVRRVKAGYASNYGMVGGDWTQGLGLLKSLPSFFKSKGTLSAAEKQMLSSYRKFKGDQHKRDANRFLFENLTR